MNSESDRRRRDAGREAAEWFVELDAHPGDSEREARLAEWLERSPEHEDAYERCDAAIMLGRVLAAEGQALYRLSEVPTAPRASRDRQRNAAKLVLGWMARPALAWSVAAMAVTWAAAVTVHLGTRDSVETSAVRPVIASDTSTADAREGRDSLDAVGPLAGSNRSAVGVASDPSAVGGAPMVESAVDSTSGFTDEDTASSRPLVAAASSSADETLSLLRFATSNPVALLPGHIVVDVHSVALLPFDVVTAVTPGSASGASSGNALVAGIATQLHDEVARQLAQIPGVFVVDRYASAAYADGELAPDQIAAYLGVRGVVDADVTLDGPVVRVRLRITDAANDGRRVETTFEHPIDELTAVKSEIVSNIADSLAATTVY